jgi:CubicO group peptidase (beta-lactamase class C family)
MIVNEGKLEYDKPIKSIVPEIEFNTTILNNEVTLRDMLSHRTGLSGSDAIWYGTDFTRAEVFSKIKFLEAKTSIRTEFIYSNFMYLAAGEIIKLKTNKTWEVYIKENILVPLDMKSTVFSIEELEKALDHAKPYKTDFIKKTTVPLEFYRQTKASAPANGINSNIIDLSHWVICQLSKGTFNQKEIIANSVIKETMKPLIISSSSIKDKELSFELFGMGRTLRTYKNHLMSEHGGAINGFRSQITLFPDDSVGIIILTNSADHRIAHFLQLEIADVILGLEKTQWHERIIDRTKKQLENQNNNPTTSNIQTKNNINTITNTSNYNGIYEHPAYGKIEIISQKNKLLFKFKLFNEELIQINPNQFDTPYHEQLGSYTITFNKSIEDKIESLKLEFEGVEAKFLKK